MLADPELGSFCQNLTRLTRTVGLLRQIRCPPAGGFGSPKCQHPGPLLFGFVLPKLGSSMSTSCWVRFHKIHLTIQQPISLRRRARLASHPLCECLAGRLCNQREQGQSTYYHNPVK
jgi:hypothetical protein